MSNENKFNQTYRDEQDHSIVVSFKNHITLKISKLLEVTNQIFRDKTLKEIHQTLISQGCGSLPNANTIHILNTQGVDAEILEPNFNSWKKGKIRMRVVLEFCPDEPEEKEEINNHKVDDNSLDDIRSTISQ